MRWRRTHVPRVLAALGGKPGPVVLGRRALWSPCPPPIFRENSIKEALLCRQLAVLPGPGVARGACRCLAQRYGPYRDSPLATWSVHGGEGWPVLRPPPRQSQSSQPQASGEHEWVTSRCIRLPNGLGVRTAWSGQPRPVSHQLPASPGHPAPYAQSLPSMPRAPPWQVCGHLPRMIGRNSTKGLSVVRLTTGPQVPWLCRKRGFLSGDRGS